MSGNQRKNASLFTVAGCAALAVASAVQAAEVGVAGRVFALDLVAHRDTDDEAQIREIAPDEFEWSLPDGLPQTLHLDLGKLKVNPREFDELRFDIMPLGSQVRLHAVLFGVPEENELCSWYLKFKTPTGEWSSGRYDLRLDDDGMQYPERMGEFRPDRLRIELSQRIVGYPGEPQWRKAVLRNVRLVKRVVETDFEPRDLEIVQDGADLAYTYRLRVKNATEQPLTAKIEVDPGRELRHFVADPVGTLSVELAAGEEQHVPIRLAMPRAKAQSLPCGYAEAICPRVWVEGVADSEVQPWIGYRRMPMWAAVPVARPPWTPAAYQARVAAAGRFMPVAGWTNGVIRRAEATLASDWPAFDWLEPGRGARFVDLPWWGQSYRCPDCKGKMRPDPPNDIHRHVCTACGRVFENHPTLDQCARQEYAAGRFADIRNLAVAWLLTAESRYADKAIVMALAYADAHQAMTVYGDRSTARGTRLGFSFLVASWMLPSLAEGISLLSAYPGLDAERRARIHAMLNDEGLRQARHAAEYRVGNQQAENLRSYGSIALATGYWPLLAEAIHGEFGYHDLIENSYSEDGVGHEGRAYHIAQTGALNHFATFAADRGVNLLTSRFKRVFDASLHMGLGGAMYELPYRQYRDPVYLATLEGARKNPSETSILHGELGLANPVSFPVVSTWMEGSGYIFLRRGTAADWREIRMTYKEQFDRDEFDRFSTFFYRNGQQVDSCVGRIIYTKDVWWWRETAAHNAIVIDGQSQRAVTGDLVAYEGTGDTPFAVVATNPAAPLYEGVAHLRGIALLGDAYVVFDRVTCDRPRTIDRYQYGMGKAVTGFKTEPCAAPPPCLPERGKFTDTRSGDRAREVRIDFSNALTMRLVCDREMRGYLANTFGGYMGEPMEVTWARIEDAREATFLAVFSLGQEAEPPAAKIVKSDDDEIVVEVKDTEKTYTLTVKPKDKKAEVVVE